MSSPNIDHLLRQGLLDSGVEPDLADVLLAFAKRTGQRLRYECNQAALAMELIDDMIRLGVPQYDPWWVRLGRWADVPLRQRLGER